MGIGAGQFDRVDPCARGALTRERVDHGVHAVAGPFFAESLSAAGRYA